MTATPPPEASLCRVLVGVEHRAHAHREQTVRLGEVDHVEFDHRVPDKPYDVSNQRRKAESTKHMQIRGESAHEWVVSTPPPLAWKQR